MDCNACPRIQLQPYEVDMVIKTKGHEFELYDSIDEMPAVRYQRYQKLLLIDAGVGADMTAIDQRLSRVVGFIKTNDKESALRELSNLRQSFAFVQTEFDPKIKAFAVLVKKIDGKPCEFTESGLGDVMRIAGEMTRKEVTANLAAVKKKIDNELTAYFPSLFVDSQTKEYYDILKKRTLAVLGNIMEGKEDADGEDVERITLKLLTFIKPTNWGGGAEVEIDKQFENICLAISEQLHTDPKKYTVLEFFNAYEVLAERSREAKKQGK